MRAGALTKGGGKKKHTTYTLDATENFSSGVPKSVVGTAREKGGLAGLVI